MKHDILVVFIRHDSVEIWGFSSKNLRFGRSYELYVRAISTVSNNASVVAVPANTPFDLHVREGGRRPSGNFLTCLLTPTRKGCLPFSSKIKDVHTLSLLPLSAPVR